MSKQSTGLDVTEIRDELRAALANAVDAWDGDDAQGIEVPATLVCYDAPIAGEYRRAEVLTDGAQPRGTVIARASVVMTDDDDDDDVLGYALRMVREVENAIDAHNAQRIAQMTTATPAFRCSCTWTPGTNDMTLAEIEETHQSEIDSEHSQRVLQQLRACAVGGVVTEDVEFNGTAVYLRIA